jgi:SAM-dependent methyltransferase
MKLIDLLNLPALPLPWEEGEKIPWNEPGFSKRMLKEHLTQQHDLASRRFERIDQHVAWIHNQILGGIPSHILDLGCGPGLYASRLARLGHTITGIDFSPASIEYARSISTGLPCTFRLEDVRSADFGQGYDLVMFIYGELNVFKPVQAVEILRKCAEALKPGGSLLLEVSTYASARGISRQPRRWQVLPGGLFSDQPHLLLTEAFWNAEHSAAVERFVVVDAASGAVTLHAAATMAYRLAQLKQMLRQAGFRSVKRYPSLTGEMDQQLAGFWVLAAQR